MSIHIKPLGDRILVQAIDEVEQIKRGGIIIPDSAKEKASTSQSDRFRYRQTR